MEELSKIILAVSKHTGYDTLHVMHGKGRQYAHARNILCHIVKSEFPHLVDSLVDVINVTKFDILKADANISARSSSNFILMNKVNDIREELALPRLEVVENKRKIPASVQLFGFKWTEEEEHRMRLAMEASVIYMNKLCRIGRQPIQEGMVFSLKKRPYEKKVKRAWYNESDKV